jgi:hypothetical protein
VVKNKIKKIKWIVYLVKVSLKYWDGGMNR